jgi:hypothetical protein
MNLIILERYIFYSLNIFVPIPNKKIYIQVNASLFIAIYILDANAQNNIPQT